MALPSCLRMHLASGEILKSRLQIHPKAPPLKVIRASQDLQTSSEACCYGCGINLQIKDPQSPGFVDPEKYTVKRRHHQLDQLLCARCQALSNGAMIPGVADFQQLIASSSQESALEIEKNTDFGKVKNLLTPEQLRQQLRQVRNSRALVVLLIDLLDASGTILGRVRDLIGGNPIIAVGTKADLLPRGTDLEAVEEWLAEALDFKRLSTDSVHLISSKTGEGIPQVVGAIKKSRLGRDVYIMGAANVGKSSFVRALVKDMSSMKSRQYDPVAVGKSKHLPMESSMPGTTLGLIPLEVFSSGGTLYDTPGLHLHHRLPHILSPEENKVLHPRKKLKGFVAPKGAKSYLWGGIARIDVVECPENTEFVFYGPQAVRVEALFDDEADEEENVDEERFAEESVVLRGGFRMARTIEFSANGSNSSFSRTTNVHQNGEPIQDIAFSGMPGWISIFSSGGDAIKLEIWAPVGVEVFSRPPMPVQFPQGPGTSE